MLENEDTLQFSPTFAKVQTEIMRMLDSIVRAVKFFPRAETKVYLDNTDMDSFLKVI